jgi:hypothetical protein
MGHMALLRRFQSVKNAASSVALNQTLKEDDARAYDCEREMNGRLRHGHMYTIYNDPSIRFCIVHTDSEVPQQVKQLVDMHVGDDNKMPLTG